MGGYYGSRKDYRRFAPRVYVDEPPEDNPVRLGIMIAVAIVLFIAIVIMVGTSM